MIICVKLWENQLSYRHITTYKIHSSLRNTLIIISTCFFIHILTSQTKEHSTHIIIVADANNIIIWYYHILLKKINMKVFILIRWINYILIHSNSNLINKIFIILQLSLFGHIYVFYLIILISRMHQLCMPHFYIYIYIYIHICRIVCIIYRMLNYLMFLKINICIQNKLKK